MDQIELTNKNKQQEKTIQQLNTLLNSFSKVEVPEVPITVSEVQQDTLVVPLFDLHIGSIVNPKESPGIYSPELTCQYIDKIFQYIKNLRPKKVLIVFGGDIVDGRNIYTGQSRTNEDLYAQLIHGTSFIMDRLLLPLNKITDLQCVGLPGNHGDISRFEDVSINDNLDIIFYGIIMKNKKIKFTKLNTTYFLCKLYNHIIYFTHGTELRSSTTTDKYFTKINNCSKFNIDLFVHGHLHNYNLSTEGNTRVLSLPSWVGTNKYSFELGYLSYPAQVLFKVNENNSLAEIHQIILNSKNQELKLHTI